ncbi:uncharacterized protein PG986_000003 [Apiospora aurea]|uniref:AA1-like domain-containing protein n=1 Tax=Apiospora aurea TaxID=335848 RepID=A0ABR1QSS6_9PEZI
MQFTIATVATKESVQITKFHARKNHLNGGLTGPVDSIDFNIVSSVEAGTMAFACTASAAEGEDSLKLKPNSYRCKGGDDNRHYAFELNSAVGEDDKFSLMIIHQTGIAFGYWGNVEIPTYCHAGGAETMVCQQIAEVTADLHL